ncbi:MAG: tripartite tricarboxylate transporter substrate binding protein [Zoogloeaceae bacterium]|jgi:tripartite-type tricarboxylate transporter receptor subunit TctC|nr:tripartite tricarboxylate transporter substrate binding protein [Zoogloeaceae bacterium]
MKKQQGRGFIRRVVSLLIGVAAVSLSGGVSLAQAEEAAWPTRQITFVVPWPAGGETDVYARALAHEVSVQLGQPVIVENKPGATGSIGIRHVVRGKADGYTFLFANTTALVGNVVSSPEPVNFDPVKDVTPVGLTVETVYVLWAHPSLGVRNFDELLARARDASKPQLAFGITGNGAVSELSVEQLARHYKLDLIKVPYKGSAPQVADLIAGHTQIGTGNLGVALGAYREGRLVPLLAIGKERLPELPDVPSSRELGFTEPDFTLWDGLFAPANTPPDIVAKLSRVVGEAVKRQSFKTIADGNGHRAIFQSGAEAANRLKNDLAARYRFKAQLEAGNK